MPKSRDDHEPKARNSLATHHVLFHGAIPSLQWLLVHSTSRNYVSRWVEVVATRTHDAKVVVDFLKFGMPKAFISDQGSHFCNKAMASLL
ncbi:hypothetical protein CR513_20647, partial [Mucuna pruriens]